VSERLREVGRHFRLSGEFLAGAPYGSGHIHDTFVATYAQSGVAYRYVHQRLNTGVFREPERLMRNVERVTDHLCAKLAARGVPDAERRHLTLLRARDGRTFHVDAEGGYWRTTRFVEGARSVDSVETPAQAYEAARAFGSFAEMLADLGPPRLADTIPDFHDLAKRFAALEEVARTDPCGRLAGVSAEFDAARSRYAFVQRALAADAATDLPRRVVHNDCKLNNLLLDEETGEGLCVIDLDTVMEGSLLCDFGELVRSATCPAPEDERELSRIRFDLDLFGALARGYLSGAASLLSEAELRALPLAGPALTLENAIRFLTDHLAGDIYFRVHRKDHNLERCRAQLQLAERMIEALDASRQTLRSAAQGG
jgi:Ser/Thr protein kinase RdoA (MazF antagonist)